MSELLVIAVLAVVLLMSTRSKRKRAKFYIVDSAEWARLLRERKDGRGWQAKTTKAEKVVSDSQDS